MVIVIVYQTDSQLNSQSYTTNITLSVNSALNIFKGFFFIKKKIIIFLVFLLSQFIKNDTTLMHFNVNY